MMCIISLSKKVFPLETALTKSLDNKRDNIVDINNDNNIRGCDCFIGSFCLRKGSGKPASIFYNYSKLEYIPIIRT